MVFDEFKILSEVVLGLDPVTVDSVDYDAQYGYGTHTDMLQWLNQKRKEGSGIYPLVWVESPVTLQGIPFAEADLKITIATLTTKDLSNLERMSVTMDPVLIPLTNAFLKALSEHESILSIDGDDFNATKHFNYNTNNDTESSDIWDVIRLEITLSFNLNCI